MKVDNVQRIPRMQGKEINECDNNLLRLMNNDLLKNTSFTFPNNVEKINVHTNTNLKIAG